jgi:hypothetical protein
MQDAARAKRDELKEQESRPNSDIPALEKERAECRSVPFFHLSASHSLQRLI